jgi:Tol biopolymer transport system component
MKTKSFFVGLFCLFIILDVLIISTRSQKAEDRVKSETILLDSGDSTEFSFERSSSAITGHPPDTIRGYDIIDIGQGTNPRFSPDSKKIAFISGGWLCIRNSDGTGNTDRIAPIEALDFQWMSDSTIIYWNQERSGTSKFTRSIKIVNLKGEEKPVIVGADESQEPVEPPIVLPDGTIGYYKHTLSDGKQSFIVIKQGSLAPDSALKQLIPRIKFETTSVMYGDIWLVSIDGSFKRWITFNRRFEFPELSPDMKRILAVKSPDGDPYLGGGPYLVDIKGNETYLGDPDNPPPERGYTVDVPGHLIYSSVGYYAKFSPDGSKVVYMYQSMDTEREDIASSDLVIKNVDGTGRFQIETPDVIEEYPVWSPDGTMLACQTYRTNKIRIIELK